MMSSSNSSTMPIVGIGASAGGVDALRQFFAHLSAEEASSEGGMAFVVILHLSPDFESNLTTILQQETELVVEEARDGAEIAGGHVYVITPGERLEIEEGTLSVTETTTPHEATSIDQFFRSLAADQGANAAGIVLSGTGTDGTLGLRAIKEAGGVAMVQSPEEAEYEDMPTSALSTGLIDLTLPSGRLAEKLAQYRDRAGSLHLPEKEEALGTEARDTLAKIFTELYTVTGHDFSGYKRSTVLRRLERRMRLRSIPNLAEYLQLLRKDEDETRALKKDLLISVTSFFRDPEAFEALDEAIIPALFEERDASDQVRVWVPGCATGEEAYSVAMQLIEHATTLDAPPGLQVFATDVDEDALAFGREGRYPKAIQADLSDERLHRFFHGDGDFYRVNHHLRETVLFAKHNLLDDPPFSDLDLVSCRNLLIYLGSELQEHVFKLLHYGLRESGYLLLGRSEATQQSGDLFSPVDKSNNILQARRLPTNKQNRIPVRPGQWTDVEGSPFEGPQREGEGAVPDQRDDDLEALHDRLLRQEVASVLVDQQHEIIHLSDRANRYLQYEGGSPSHELLDSVGKELRSPLRSVLHQAFEEGEPTRSRDLSISIDGDPHQVTLIARPVDRQDRRYVQVRFQERPGPTSEETDAEARTDREGELRAELERTQEQLQTTNEEYEAATEEMETANEELLSMNEELQAKNEELETSKEEIQSVNEELKTTNQELKATNQDLKAKIEEVREANSAIENLMAATEIATLFLDREFTILRFTPRVTELFGIREGDVGRPLTDFTQQFEYDDLLDHARTVLRDETTIEREVHMDGDRWFLARLRPYRTVQGDVEGVVLTFVEITERRRLERELVNTTERVRREIGQDLHDILSSDLAALTIKVGNLKSQLSEKEDAEIKETLSEVEDMAREGADQARTLSHALVPVALQEEHLAAALKNLCREQEELTGLRCIFEGDREEALPANEETATHFYRIAHEALVNAEQHAEADEVRMGLQQEGGVLAMRVRDDGKGIPDDLGEEKGLGLRTMDYRSNLIGASLTVESAEGDGTLVRCTLPLDEAREE